MKNNGGNQAFTLIEVIVVVAVISILIAILLPVFLSSRKKARSASCLSNLRHIGLAVSLYAQDNDQLFPYGGDPLDIHTDYWAETDGPEHAVEARRLSPLQDILLPYTTSHEIWRCPSDTGFREMETADGSGYPFSASPSSFIAYGTSYYYRTEVIFM